MSIADQFSFEDSKAASTFDSELKSGLQEHSFSSTSCAREIYQQENNRIASASKDLPQIDIVDFSQFKRDANNQVERVASYDGEVVGSKTVPFNLSGDSSKVEADIPSIKAKVELPSGLQPGQTVEFSLVKESNGSGKNCLVATCGNRTWVRKDGGILKDYWKEK